MNFMLVDVQAINATHRILSTDEGKQIKQIAESVLECGGLIIPLIVKHDPNDILRYILINGYLRYRAVQLARQREPRMHEMVNAVVTTEQSVQAVQEQVLSIRGLNL